MIKNKRKQVVSLVVTVMALSAVGLVYAAWTTSGSGSVYAKAGSSQSLTTVDASASTSATLYPGATGDVVLKVSNPNSYPIRVTGVALNGTNADITPDSGHSGCTTTGVSFTGATGLTLDVPAKSGGTNGTAQHTLTGAASMSNASVDGCQGATFTIPVSLTGASNAS
jgi:hypothetical protein